MPLRPPRTALSALRAQPLALRSLRRHLPPGHLLLLLVAILTACTPDNDAPPAPELPAWDGETLFELLDPEAVLDQPFVNDLRYEEEFNIYRYRNFYNGGGVALGDVNNDGLTDIFVTANRGDNRLYLNEGDWKFRDVTLDSYLISSPGWSTGATMADVNGDGFLDIYVCNSGDIEGADRKNELWINNGKGTFSDQAEAYGLANEGLSTHAVFFDYDQDGDLDCYLLNNSYQAIGSFNLRRNERPKRDAQGGDVLYRNDDGKFTDVSEEAGIYGSIIGFGLGVTVGDVDRNGFPDIYVSNDFFERDYLYMNRADGTFEEVLTESMNSISAASMGADMADINNDGLGEIFVTEMLPPNNARIKTSTTFENWNKYQFNLDNDYYHQFTRNMLQRNNGDGTFSEIGRQSGVEATDWSWGALFFDMDNDGYKDLFVANGIYQDLTNRDFLDYIADDEFKREVTASGKVDFKKLVDAIPSNPVPNHAFRNRGPAADYTFEDVAAEYGLDLTGFSNGSAYGDLDNDGDLDLVVNNVNMPLAIYRNHTRERFPERHWLQLKLGGEEMNTRAVGAAVTVWAGGEQQFLENMPMRGFQSSMDYRLHFGLGEHDVVDTLRISFPGSGYVTQFYDVEVDQLLEINDGDGDFWGTPSVGVLPPDTRILRPVELRGPKGLVHTENMYSDFDRDPLLYHMLSAEGPALCAGDFNGDGRKDFYLGGARGFEGVLNLAGAGNTFDRAPFPSTDAESEDVACACFDADGDGDDDLYVVSGSSEFKASSTLLLDRLYLNEGRGRKWRKSEQLLPSGSRVAVGSVVVAQDVDGDGDQDLFVGSRMRPGLYGAPADSYLLLNDGRGKFTDSKQAALADLGMVTAATWVDLTDDPGRELVVLAEYQSPRVFAWSGGELDERTVSFARPRVQGDSAPRPPEGEEPADYAPRGWYTSIASADLDGDGRMDLILGNHGTNSRFRASEREPVILHVNDFDQNGTPEQIISTFEDGKAYPAPLLHDLVRQMPGLRKKYLRYSSFGDQTMEDIFPPEVLEQSVRLEANEFRSLVLLNRGGHYETHYLPTRAQESPIHAIQPLDYDGDGDVDLLVGGNFYYVKPEMGRYDASRGLLLENDGTGRFTAVDAEDSGVKVSGEIREIVDLGAGRYLLGRNNDVPVLLERNAGR